MADSFRLIGKDLDSNTCIWLNVVFLNLPQMLYIFHLFLF